LGIVRMGPPTEIILKLKEAYGISNFIETGTYRGDTAIWASRRFEKVITIEYSKSIYEQVTEKYSQTNNIEFLYGDTRTKLKEITSKLDTPSLFWLDAHWSGGETYGQEDECPLIEEIEIINSSKYDNFIFIDDARLFTSPPPSPHSIEQWPDITTVLKALNSSNTRKYIVIVEDVIIAVPELAKSVVAHHYQDLSTRTIKEHTVASSSSLPYRSLKFLSRVLGKRIGAW